MKKNTITVIIATIILSFLLACGSKNETEKNVSQPKQIKETVFIHRNGKDFCVNKDSLATAFVEKDSLDKILSLLSDSIKKRGKIFPECLAAFEKIQQKNNTYYVLYPNFKSRHTSEEEFSFPTKMTISLLKKDSIQRDTLVFSWVEGDERKVDHKAEKRLLKKGTFFVDIECPMGYNNAYFSSENINKTVAWICKLLSNDSVNTTYEESSNFYGVEMQFNSASRISFTGIDYR